MDPSAGRRRGCDRPRAGHRRRAGPWRPRRPGRAEVGPGTSRCRPLRPGSRGRTRRPSARGASSRCAGCGSAPPHHRADAPCGRSSSRARVIWARTHQRAYVEKRMPRSGSKRFAARSRPMKPSCTRSSLAQQRAGQLARLAPRDALGRHGELPAQRLGVVPGVLGGPRIRQVVGGRSWTGRPRPGWLLRAARRRSLGALGPLRAPQHDLFGHVEPGDGFAGASLRRADLAGELALLFGGHADVRTHLGLSGRFSV